MMTGDSYKLPISLQLGNIVADDKIFKELEVFFGDVRKTLSSGEITYDQEQKVFLVPLSQKETFRQNGDVKVEIRCKFLDDSVIGASAGTVNVEKSTSKVVL